MALFKTFIIEDNCLIMITVTYHSQIVTQKNKINGGDRFLENKLSNIYTFYGNSKDYGKASVEDIQACINNGKVFFSVYKTTNISGNHNFLYNTGIEIIVLEKFAGDSNSFVSAILRDAANSFY